MSVISDEVTENLGDDWELTNCGQAVSAVLAQFSAACVGGWPYVFWWFEQVVRRRTTPSRHQLLLTHRDSSSESSQANLSSNLHGGPLLGRKRATGDPTRPYSLSDVEVGQEAFAFFSIHLRPDGATGATSLTFPQAQARADANGPQVAGRFQGVVAPTI